MRFQVFKNGRVVEKFDLQAAYLFGTDGIAIRHAQITFSGGVIDCSRPNMETVGLALLWPIEGFGQVLLPTTCLSEREKVYNLNVEIARAKLMQIIDKREDWAFFSESDELGNIFSQCQELFIRAIQNISDSALAAKLADESLEKAILFSEKLAIRQAQTAFDMRVKSRGFGRGCLGCKIEPDRVDDTEYVDKVIELFGYVTIPISWGQIESVKGKYDFSDIDRCVEVFGSKKLSLGGGPLLCFSRSNLPAWLTTRQTSFEKIRDRAYKFVSAVVGRYSGSIRRWRVISGLNAFNYFGFGFEQVLEMTRAVNMAVKAADSSAFKIIEVVNPWGEYYADAAQSIPPWVYMDMVSQSGINFEAFGLQMRFGRGHPGMHVRDMMQISAILDYFLAFDKPLYITEVAVPSANTGGGGVWHKVWDQQQQRQWIEQFYRVALSKPFVDTVTYSNLADNEKAAISNSGLLTGKLANKESFESLKKMHKIIFTR